jgi:hypothetical protein
LFFTWSHFKKRINIILRRCDSLNWQSRFNSVLLLVIGNDCQAAPEVGWRIVDPEVLYL